MKEGPRPGRVVFQKATTEKSKKVVLLLAMLMQQVEVAFAALVGALVGEAPRGVVAATGTIQH